LHPFMPFITEELWWVTGPVSVEPERMTGSEAELSRKGDERPDMLALTAWPSHEGLDDPEAEAEIGWVVDLVTTVRSLRSEMNIPPATMVPLVLVNVSEETQARAERWLEFVKRLARTSELVFMKSVPEGAVQFLVRGEIAALPLKGVIDINAERARLQKELAKAESDIARVDQKLGNPKFVANAAEEVVEGEKEKREEAEARRAKILEALERLKGAA
jgi:valyl-tRNA synthetase